MVFAAIPSPSRGVVHLGPVPLRAYALMIIIGIVVAVVVTGRRLRARGMDPALAGEIAYWAVPFGIVGARIYHVLSTPDAYFGEHGHVADVVKIWNGGLGIWGAIAGGALGAWLAARRLGISLALFADAAAPGIILAQAIGRWGNWFNQELYGKPTTLPWAVRIDPAHRADPGVATYQPTFLYEFLWNLVVAAILLLVDRRHRLGRGRLFALYVALYTFGRLWIEMLRIDTADEILGLRVNIWTSAIVCVGAVVALLVVRRPVDPDVSPQEQRALGLVQDRTRRQPTDAAGETAGETRTATRHDDATDGVDVNGADVDGADPSNVNGANVNGADPVNVNVNDADGAGAGAGEQPVAGAENGAAAVSSGRTRVERPPAT
ncbi:MULTISPECIES: prolipoprotein diacylglyceryl transferase [Frankia]|uniref:Phosphatidylglycerol--prolipoprotein diacylglyceryl transferase n=2 Tax=Frankia TaxID=1854 RepID=LGT_FRAAA|nr:MULTISPECIES: prolipoprotein diacylglyceryl transferase [Frankia]Q0RFY2.1 RecName: Full=Phosphatidylglycerol--prolipoprotein diacylglyceryl transferase [Frankia alni ACN14a]CAJ63607.1 Prolipoprotein diacylglyceryl transferase (partial match) [Frankia alni ACN14a]